MSTMWGLSDSAYVRLYIFSSIYFTFSLYYRTFTLTLTLLSLRIYCYLHVPVITLRSTHFHYTQLCIIAPDYRPTLYSQRMITSIEIPHLAKGQKISQFKKVFLAATSTLKPDQQLACLPVYIHRTEGEKQLAFTASEEEDVTKAFKFLEDLIDGPPYLFTESTSFFNLLSANTSMDGIWSYFFQLDKVAKCAKIPTDVFIMQFMTNNPGGKKLFESKKDKIKSDLDAAGVANFFKDCMEKLQKNSTSSETSGSETFAFPVEQEEQVPQWARELQKDMDELRSRLDVTDEEDTEMYSVQADRKFGKKDRPICDI